MKIYIDFKHQIVATRDNLYETIKESDTFEKYFKHGWKDSDGYDIFKFMNPNTDKFKYEELDDELQRSILGELLCDFFSENFKEYEIDVFGNIYENDTILI